MEKKKVQHTTRTKEEASAIFRKVENALQPIAVWHRNGLIRMCKLDTQLFRESIAKKPRELVGVYDSRCLLEWLEDDLAYVGVR